MKKLAKTSLVIFLMVASGLSCSKEAMTLHEKIQFKADSLRHVASEIIGSTISSLNLMVETPNSKYFVSSSDNGQPEITEDTWFRFASITKTFTSAAIMNMSEDGWLDYNHRITDPIPGTSTPYVPALPEWDIPFKDQITIGMLLNHTAGVFDVDNESLEIWADTCYVQYKMLNNPDHQFSVNELLWEVARNDLYYFLPGEGQQYSDTGYTMLSEIIARVYSAQSGEEKSYADYLYDYLYGPATTVPIGFSFPDQADNQQLPSPYVTGTYIEPDGNIKVFDQVNMSAHLGEGNGLGTLQMLNAFARTLYSGKNVLQTKTIQTMMNQTMSDSELGVYGFGIEASPIGWGHTGAIYGYFSIMYYDAVNDISVVGFVPYWDFTEDMPAPFEGLISMVKLGWEVRKLLGY